MSWAELRRAHQLKDPTPILPHSGPGHPLERSSSHRGHFRHGSNPSASYLNGHGNGYANGHHNGY